MDNEEQLAKFWEEDLVIFLNYLKLRLFDYSEEYASDLILDGLFVLKKKYIEPGLVVPSQENIRKVMFGITKILILKYNRIKTWEKIDNMDVESTRMSDEYRFSIDEAMSSDKALFQTEAPSLYIRRRYRNEWYARTKAERNCVQRAYYLKRRSYFIQKAQQPTIKARKNEYSKKLYSEIKANELRYEDYKQKRNERRRAYRLEKKLGTWTDGRKKPRPVRNEEASAS